MNEFDKLSELLAQEGNSLNNEQIAYLVSLCVDPEYSAGRVKVMMDDVSRRVLKERSRGEKKKAPYSMLCTAMEGVLKGMKQKEASSVALAKELSQGVSSGIPFTGDDWKVAKQAHEYRLKTLLLDHKDCEVMKEMEKEGVLDRDSLLKSRSITQFLNKLEGMVKTLDTIKQLREESEEWQRTYRDSEINHANSEYKEGRINEKTRKMRVIKACKDTHLTQKETAELIDIPIRSVKRYWPSV